MRQLVGLKCARCAKTTPSIIEGHYCAECGCPVHNRCAVPDVLEGCRLCGASLEAAKANLQVEKAEAVQLEKDVRVNNGFRHISVGFACLVAGGLGSLFCGFLGLALLVVGLAEIVHGIIVLTRKGPPKY